MTELQKNEDLAYAYEQYSALIRHVAFRVTSDRPLSDRIVKETFSRAERDTLGPPLLSRLVRAWLLAITADVITQASPADDFAGRLSDAIREADAPSSVQGGAANGFLHDLEGDEKVRAALKAPYTPENLSEIGVIAEKHRQLLKSLAPQVLPVGPRQEEFLALIESAGAQSDSGGISGPPQ
jgi:hypothetical protein